MNLLVVDQEPSTQILEVHQKLNVLLVHQENTDLEALSLQKQEIVLRVSIAKLDLLFQLQLQLIKGTIH